MFSENMIIYIEIHKESTNNISKISKFSEIAVY